MRSICLGIKGFTRCVIAFTVCFGFWFWGVLAWPADAFAQSVHVLTWGRRQRLSLCLVRRNLASHGYLVALLYHYRANTYDSSALYVRNRLCSGRAISAWTSPIFSRTRFGDRTSTKIRLAWRGIRRADLPLS